MPTTNGQVVALAIALSAAASALAQPVIRVESATRVELSTRRAETGAEVRVLLLDDQGAAIPGAPVSYRVASATGRTLAAAERALTGSDGSLAIELGAVEEQVSVEARFAGDDFRSAAGRVELLDTRLSRSDLFFVAPAEPIIDLRQQAIAIRIRLRNEQGASALRVALYDEQDLELGAAVTNAEGIAELSLETAMLGQPGAGKLVARFQGDRTRAPAIAELSVVRWLPTQATFALAKPGSASVRFSGRVQAGERGVPGAVVGVFTVDGEHVTTVRSSDDGLFEGELDLELPGLELRARRAIELEARFDSDAPWLGSSRSARVRLALADPSLESPYWLAIAPLTIALALWWLGRRRALAERSIEPPQTAEAGVALATTKARAARPLGIACTVLDARTGKPLAAATLEWLDSSGARRVTRSDARGRLRIDDLAPGHHRLSFHADGYRTLDATIDAPHRGEWLGAQVRLDSLRDVALRAWAPIATQHADKPEQASALTLRETFKRLRQPSALDEALLRVESAAYERDAPNEDDVARIERDASALLQRPRAREE